MKKIIHWVVTTLFFMSLAMSSKAEGDVNNVPEVSNGQLEIITAFKSQFIGERNVYVWLPEGIEQDKKYPVLYMHDGQMLFDQKVTWNGQAWDVDDVAYKLIKEEGLKKFIVVGIDNAGEKHRAAEYFPQKAIQSLQPACDDVECQTNMFGAELYADQYLRFIVEELKPLIGKKFPALTNRDNSFLMGSSMGGLISMYALTEYPNEFIGAACLSTHWLGATRADQDEVAKLSKALISYVDKYFPENQGHRVYFDYGTKGLDQFYGPFQTQVDEIMSKKGYDQSNWLTEEFVGADHDEVSWNKRLDVPLQFLFGE